MKTRFKDVAHLYLGCRFYSIKSKMEKLCSLTDYYEAKGYMMPILYPLASMTEEQKDKIFPSDINEPVSEFVLTLKSDMFLYPDQFVKLLAEGFDLFGLIESGEAIDATTL